MENHMGLEQLSIPMEIYNTRVALNMVNSMVKGLTFIKMEIDYMKVNTKITNMMDMEHLFMKTEI